MTSRPNPGPASDWRARYHPGFSLEPVRQLPSPDDPDWRPFRQHWLPNGPDARFQPAWARIRWNEAFLAYDIVMVGRGPRNAARSLNERTWETGDIGEIFLQGRDSAHYIELHVTPENQRLQLRWTPEEFRAFRASGGANMEKFTIGDPDWVQAAAHLAPDHWSVCALLPIESLPLGQPAFGPGMALKTAVCRYDCTAGPGFLGSSTALLTQANYHHRDDWDDLRLVPRGASS